MIFIRLLVLLLLAPLPAQAWTSAVPHLDDNPFTEIYFHHGFVPVTTNNQRVTINVGTTGPQYANIAVGVGFTTLPNNCASPPCADANGYPNQTPTNGINSNPGNPAGYYGTITWSWSGSGQMQDATGMPAIFTSICPQGAVFELGNVGSNVCGTQINVDHAPASYCFCTQSLPTALANPSIVFQYGWNIQSIDNDGGLIRINTKTNFANSCNYTIINGPDQNGNIGPLVNITGAVANTGANGTWAITNCGASSFDLVASTFTNAQASAQGTAIFAGGNLVYSIRNNSTFSGFSNLVIAETPNVAVINAGHYWDPVYVTQLRQLMNPSGTCAANHDCGWLRFMDFSAVQNNWESDFTQRIPGTALSYQPSSWYPKSYWSSSAAGAITNTGASGNFTDAYTTGDPPISVWNGSRYIDGAVVQGVPSATNTGITPALNVGGHGLKPIIPYGSISNGLLFLTGLPGSAGLTMQFTFQASWLNSGTPVVVNYTTVSGDTSATCTLAGNLTTFFLAQTTLTNAGIIFTDGNCAQGPQIGAPTPQAGVLTVTYTSGPAIVTIGTAPASTVSNSGSGGIRTFQYNYLMDAFIYQNGNNQGNGFSFSAPLEAAIDLANQVGANVWWNHGFTSSAYITSHTQLFAANLSPGLKYGFEAFNETWNSFAHPYAQMQGIAASFGFSNSNFLANAGYTGLKTKQYGDVAKAAWTGAGRAASDFAVFSEWQTGVGVGSTFDVNLLQGAPIGTANTYIANYGALGGGTVATNYAASPNRPVDITNFIGMAPYWGSEWWGCSISTAQCGEQPISGTVAQNIAWLQAVLDYQNGSTATAYTELTNTFNGTTQATGCRASAQVLGAQANCSFNYHNFNVNMENIAAGYDAGRPGGMPKVGIAHYEAAPQWAFTSNYISGTNSATDAQSIAQMAIRYGNATVNGAYGSNITGLSWNVGPWIKSGQPAVSSGTYNSGTGLVTLTLASPLTYTAASSFTGTITAVSGFYNLNVVSGLTGNIYVGQAVNYPGIPAGYYVMAQKSGTPGGIGSYILNNTGVSPITASTAITTADSITTALTGTGSVASLNGTFTTTPTTSGSTISYTAGTGLTLTITGGTVYDSTASSYELAINTVALGQTWKNDATYKNLIKTFYYQDLATVSGANREAHAAQFGYDANTWGLFPSDYHGNNPYQNYNAIQEWNAGN